ncbi:MAG: PKD domain-containing protein [Bacteroidota bacterium]|nr:PKD domain-containing protein [Bacteroidota bacterium]
MTLRTQIVNCKFLFIILFISWTVNAWSQCNYGSLITAPNIVVNGDFNLGNTSFTSDYLYSTVNPLNQNLYVITTNAANVHWAFAGTDHTTGSGNFMVLNGNIAPANVWKQTVSVSPNTYYNFSAWFKNIVQKPTYAGSPIATVELWINNVKISNSLPLVDYPDIWKLLDTSWFSGSATSASLAIKNLGTSAGGNDFAIDDVAFKQCCSAIINLGPDQLICEGDSFVFNNTAPGSYVWSPVYAISNNKIPNPTVRPLVPVNYYVTVTNGSCISRDTIHFDIINVNASAGTDKSICAGDSVQLNGSAVGFYSWSPVTNISNPGILNPMVYPLITTEYILTSTATTCTKRDTVLITVISQVPAYAGSDVAICYGSSVQLNGTYGAGANNGLWLSNYAISDPTLPDPVVSPLVDTSYIFRAGFGNSCYGYDTMQVTVISYPTVNAGSDIHYCFNSLGQINATIINYDSFYWKPVTGLFNSQALATAVSGNINTKYILVASNKGCESKDSLYLVVQPKVIAQFKATPPVSIAPAQIQFTNQSQNAYFYLWDFGDGITGSEINPLHVYTNTGTYKVWLVIADSLGCTDSTSFDIRLFYSPYLFPPNAFTPNADGTNDGFGLIYNPDAFSYIKYSIYNRWGELLYQTTMPGGKWWDGTFKGLSCEADVYVYVIEAEDLTGKMYAISGNVTLLR